MDWKSAVKYMEQGGRITRKGWHVDDYLYMENGILKDDGGNEFLPRLKGTKGNWLKSLTPAVMVCGKPLTY